MGSVFPISTLLQVQEMATRPSSKYLAGRNILLRFQKMESFTLGVWISKDSLGCAILKIGMSPLSSSACCRSSHRWPEKARRIWWMSSRGPSPRREAPPLGSVSMWAMAAWHKEMLTKRWNSLRLWMFKSKRAKALIKETIRVAMLLMEAVQARAFLTHHTKNLSPLNLWILHPLIMEQIRPKVASNMMNLYLINLAWHWTWEK